MVQTLVWIILIILPCIRASTTTPDIQKQTPSIQCLGCSIQTHPSRNNEDIENRLIRLEVLLEVKLENSNQRLQALEWQSVEIHSTLKSFRSDLARIVQQAPATPVQQSTTMPEQSVEDLSKDVKQLMTAATILTADVNNLKKNVVSLITDTRKFSQSTNQSDIMLEEAVADLHKDVKTLQTFLTSDVNDLKKNVSSLINDTRSILRSTSDFATKQYVNQVILDLQHQPAASSNSLEFSTALPKNCREVKESGQTLTGIYNIQPEHFIKPISVVCDLQTRGGGWIVIQNRFDGSEDFYRNWQEYKHGFGNLSGEFWLGLDTIHQLTGYQANELLIELQDFKMQKKTAYYASFSVGPEVEKFPLKILKGYDGDAGDSLSHHRGIKFTTKDVDNISDPGEKCQQELAGAWWHRNCGLTNLNGQYLREEQKKSTLGGVLWYNFQYPYESLKRTKMLVRQGV